MESLFEKIERISEDCASYDESQFSYLNRTARLEYAIARETLDKWYNSYFSSHPVAAIDLKGNFCSSDDEHHLAALTELYVYNVLLTHGYTAIPHPEVSGTSSRPDFLVKRDGVEEFYVEVATIHGTPEKKRFDKFDASIKEAINSINSPLFLVSYEHKKFSVHQPPSIGSIRRDIEIKINDAIENGTDCFEWLWEKSGWSIEFTITRVSEEAGCRRDSSSNVLGMVMYPARWISLAKAINSRVKKKLNSYGRLSLPLIVVVNIIGDSIFCDDSTIMECLFGEEQITAIKRPDESICYRNGRSGSGLFVHPAKGVIHTRLSALMVLRGLMTPVLNKNIATIWHHPKALHPLNKSELKFRQMVYNQGNGRFEEL